MNDTLKVSVNKEHHFDFTEEQMQTADAVSLDQKNFHVLHNNTSYHAEVVNTDFINKTYTVVVNNNEYVVSIANHLDQLIKEMGFEVGKAKVVNAIKAPMPGLILEINVAVGQEVQEGDNLLILEAMKMENDIVAEVSGTISKILVEEGAFVQAGSPMVEVV